MSISPYPEGVKIKQIAEGTQIFLNGKYIGETENIQNWGKNYRARNAKGEPLGLFASRTEATWFIIKNHDWP